MPPGRRFAILTCMDARLDPAKCAGLAEGDAHVIRTAGGRARDDVMRKLPRSSLKTASVDASGGHDTGGGGGSPEGEHISWLTIPNQEQSVLEDVQRIRNHPLVPADIPLYGYIYDVKSGKLIEVPAATEAGRVQ